MKNPYIVHCAIGYHYIEGSQSITTMTHTHTYTHRISHHMRQIERERERERERTYPSIIQCAHEREDEEGEEGQEAVSLTDGVAVSLAKTSFKQLDI